MSGHHFSSAAFIDADVRRADGINAAINWRGHGRSRWQLSDKITAIAGVHVRGRSIYFAVREAGCGPFADHSVCCGVPTTVESGRSNRTPSVGEPTETWLE
jgi:hypothetical protein